MRDLYCVAQQLCRELLWNLREGNVDGHRHDAERAVRQHHHRLMARSCKLCQVLGVAWVFETGCQQALFLDWACHEPPGTPVSDPGHRL